MLARSLARRSRSGSRSSVAGQQRGGGLRARRCRMATGGAAADVASGSAALLANLDPELGPAAAYAHLVAEGLLVSDDDQVGALEPLDGLFAALAGARLSRPPQAFVAKQKTTSIDDGRGGSSARDGYMGEAIGLFGGGKKGGGRWFGGSAKEEPVDNEPKDFSAHQGVYLHGGVGCGKTFILDLFYHCISVRHERDALHSWGDGPPAARVHFHQFMADVNKRIYLMRAGNHEGDPM